MDETQVRTIIREEFQSMKDELRVELLAIELGDDYVVEEETAAQLLGVHPETLAKKRRQGELPTGALGQSPRYSLGQLRRMMRRIADPTR